MNLLNFLGEKSSPFSDTENVIIIITLLYFTLAHVIHVTLIPIEKISIHLSMNSLLISSRVKTILISLV